MNPEEIEFNKLSPEDQDTLIRLANTPRFQPWFKAVESQVASAPSTQHAIGTRPAAPTYSTVTHTRFLTRGLFE